MHDQILHETPPPKQTTLMIALRAQLVPLQPNPALLAQIEALQAQIDQLSSLAQVVMIQLQALLQQRR